MIHDINRLPTLHIGHEKDSLTNTICIDVQPWLQDTPTLNTWEIVVNNPNGDVYMAEKVTMENGMLEWVVTASDTQYPGKGSYEVVATGPNGESISTGPVALRVDKRTEGTVSPDAPSAEAGWVNNVINAAARAEDAAERAESAAEGNAEVLAEKIAPVIGANGNWWTWDFESDTYVDTGKPTRGEKGDKGDAAEGSVKSVNGVQPDKNGNVQVEIPEAVSDEHIREVVKNLDPTYLPEGYGSAQITPKKYGAVGDGSTDDTAAFQQALAENREVYVPGGTYKLSGPLTVRGNCGLTLAQDVVLDFTQYSGDCISMQMSASIKGNHATVRVPYSFSGHVIHVASLLDANVLAIPPFTKWDPSWKTGRYLTDLNIVKPDSRGFHYSLNGDCSGVAVYISADNDASNDTDSTFIWGLNFSGVRIAGAFTHGILCENFREAWNHEMRIEAFIDACETGVELRDCNNAYISAAIQPRRAYSLSEVYKAYAKNGIVLRRSRNTDLSGSRVWDWNDTYTLWKSNVQYEHIAMYGNCSGTILNDFFYYEMPSYDIRDLIYTDTAANLEKINILQEPFTRWFKKKDDAPYFSDGIEEKRLALKSELDELVPVDRTLGFTDVLSTATDEDGNVFNGVGYKNGMRWNAADGKGVIAESYYTATGYIPVRAGQTLHVEGMSMEAGDNVCGIVLFDTNKNRLTNVQKQNIIGGGSYYVGYEQTENGFNIPIKNPADTAYVKLSVWKANVHKPLMAVDEEIKYTLDGYLADGIKVKAESVTGLEELIREIVGK